MARRAAGVAPDRRPELDRDRGRVARLARRRRPDPQPQTRFFTDPPTETNEAAIATCWRPALHRVGKPDAAGALAVAAVVEAVRHPDLARRRADRAGRPARAARPLARAALAQPRRRSATREPRLPPHCRWRCSLLLVVALRLAPDAPGDTSIRSQLVGQAGAGFRASRGLPGSRPGLDRSRRASRVWSTSSPAGACPASPKRRCSQQLQARGVVDRRHRHPRPARGRRRLPRPQRQSRSSASAPTSQAGSSWLWARPACRKASSSMAAASSATSMSARSSRSDVPTILAAAGDRRSEALAVLMLFLAAQPRSPTAICRRRNGPTASSPTRARRPRPRR